MISFNTFLIRLLICGALFAEQRAVADSLAGALQTAAVEQAESAATAVKSSQELDGSLLQDDSPLQMVIEDADSVTVPGPEKGTLALRLTLSVRLRNQTDEALKVSRNQFQLLVSGDPAAMRDFNSRTEIGEVTIAPKQSVSGVLTFSDIDYRKGEPSLVLKWLADGQLCLLPLNDEIRRICHFQQERIGPSGCLQLCTVNRAVDLLSTWVLADILKDAEKQGIRRLVVAAGTPGLAVRTEALLWLSTAHSGYRPGRLSIPMPASPIFLELHLAGFERSSVRRFAPSIPGADVVQHNDATSAVAAALETAMQQLSESQAFDEIDHPHPGVRMAAIRSIADRIDPGRLPELLKLAETGDDQQRVSVIQSLHLVPSPDAIPLLARLAQESNTQISAAALQSLTRSQGDVATKAIQDLWEQSEKVPDFRIRLIDAVLTSGDSRWADVLVMFVETALREQRSDSGSTTTDSEKIPVDALTTYLKPALTALTRSHTKLMGETVRSSLMEIHDPRIQDLLAEFLMEVQTKQDAPLFRSWIAARLKEGTINDTVLHAVFLYPDPDWTDPLLNHQQADETFVASRRKTLAAALRCVNSEQADGLASRFADYDSQSQVLILQHLAFSEHPEWKQLASRAIEQMSGAAGDAMDILHQDGSEESIQILNAALRSHLTTLTAASERKPDDPLQNQTERLISKVSLFSHPECRRTLNRSLRHSSQRVRQRSQSAVDSARRRSPAELLLVELMKMKSEGKFAEALARATECVETDSTLPEAWLYRASLYLRHDRLDEAMADLRRADELSPEDPATNSTIALVMVRTGHLDAGLQMAEETLALIPDDEGTLYNTACVYARAAEKSLDHDQMRIQYLTRATDLLRRSATAGFSDVEHLQNDPDLIILHDHADWPEIVRLVTTRAPEVMKSEAE